MTPFEHPGRRCPRCESRGYLFRARKNVEADGAKFAETKYRCRACSHVWRERIPAPEKPPNAA